MYAKINCKQADLNKFNKFKGEAGWVTVCFVKDAN